MVADHLGFCTECYDVYEPGKDENGNSVKLLRKEKAYIDLAAEHTLSSPDTAFQIVNGTYEKMLIELAIDEYIHIVELRLKSADNNSVTYEYCADHNNDWGKIHFCILCTIFRNKYTSSLSCETLANSAKKMYNDT